MKIATRKDDATWRRKESPACTPGTRGFSCTISIFGQVFIVICVKSFVSLLRLSCLGPGANSETSHHMREKNFLYPGEDIWLFSLPSSCFLPCGWYFSSSWHIALALLSFASYTFSSTLIVPILHQKLTNLRYNSNRKKLQNGKMKRIWWMGLQPMEFF